MFQCSRSVSHPLFCFRYPERYAQRVLGQNSKIVHRVYAKKAQKQLPSLEEYEEAMQKAQKRGKVVVLEHEAEVPKVT
jgi:hypothetical protein